jgi:MSHA biogenesis protein MshJ
MKSIRELWQPQARRIDALSLRERAIMFVSLAVAMAAATDALVLTPQVATNRTLVAQAHERAVELAALKAQLAAADSAADTPQRRLRQRLAALQDQRRKVDASISQRLAIAAEGTGLPELLAQVLRRHDRLALLKLDSTAAAPRAADDALAGLPPQRGVDLQIAGHHADLVAYLTEIEQRLPGLRWSDLHIDARSRPPVLSVRVFLPGAGA